MTKRYKTKDKDKPYGLTRDGVPRKRPGRRKGSAKSPGTGRSKQPIELRLDIASDELALAVISGEPIHQYGATGKAFTAPANLSLRQKFAEVWWNRRRPTLTATAVKAEVETSHVYEGPVDRRHLARSVLSILKQATIAEEAENPTPQPPPIPVAQLMIGRDKIIETTFTEQHQSGTKTPAAAEHVPAPSGGQPSVDGVGDDVGPTASSTNASSLSSAASSPGAADGGAGPSWPASPVGSSVTPCADGTGEGALTTSEAPSLHHPSKRPHAFRVEAKGYGRGHMLWHAQTKRWHFFDDSNHEHSAIAGVRGDDAKALARLEELGRSSLPWQSHPWQALGGDTSNVVPRKDNAAYMTKPQHLINSRGRRRRL